MKQTTYLSPSSARVKNVCGAVCAVPPHSSVALLCGAEWNMQTVWPWMKCFHVNEQLPTAQTVLWTVVSGLPLKIMYLFTGYRDKMPFHVIKNDHVIFICTHCHLGPDHWLHVEVVVCVVDVLCVEHCITVGSAATLVY